MWRQLFEVLRPALFPQSGSSEDQSQVGGGSPPPQPGKLMLCGFSGAALFTSDAGPRDMVEDIRYRETALLSHQGGGGSTCIPLENLDAIQAVCVKLVDRVFQLASEDPAYIPQLSKKYHEPYTELVELRKADLDRFHREVLTYESLSDHGRYLTATNDALLDAQWIPGTSPRVIVQFSILGVPMARFDEVFTPDVRLELEQLGVYCKKQPNSVVVAPHGVDKATCVRWLIANEPTFSLERAIAFGDVPSSIDKPLTMFPPMPFVSVSTTPDCDPPGVIAVGGEEKGTAHFLAALLEAATEVADFGSNTLLGCAEKARKALEVK